MLSPSQTKGIDFFCASQASIDILKRMADAAVPVAGGRAIDRHNPIIRDERRGGVRSLLSASVPTSPARFSSQPPVDPNLYNQLHCGRNEGKRLGSDKKESGPSRSSNRSKKPSGLGLLQRAVSSPAGSSRFLLSDVPVFDVVSDLGRVVTSVPVEGNESLADDRDIFRDEQKRDNDHQNAIKKQSSDGGIQNRNDEASVSEPSSSSPATHQEQVVVLRVSLHCKGCERKVRKLISRMEGVTSFQIDFTAKKVTVIGDVTPLGVLSSISKVKNAQLLTPGFTGAPTVPF